MSRPLPLLLALALAACDGTESDVSADPPDAVDAQASADAAFPADAAPDAEEDVPDAGVPVDRALVLDLEMSDPIAWSLVREVLEARGYEVTYRREFPHFTDADAARYALVVVGAGGAPSSPTDWMRAPEVERLADFVRGGGAVVLAPRNRWRDGLKAAFDNGAFNALLRLLEVGLRVDLNTIVGDVAVPDAPKPPLHQTVPWGYVGPLEWTLLLPVGFPAEEAVLGVPSPFAAGWTSGLACDGDDITLLARTHADAITWWQLDGPDDTRITFPGTAQPLAAVAPAGDGWVAVLPRAVLELTTLPADGGARPSLEPVLLEGTEAFARAALDRVDDLHRGLGLHFPTGCEAGRALAEVDAERDLVPPDLPLPEVVPSLPDWAAPPDPTAEQTAVPDWFRAGKVRLAYGDLGDAEQMRGHFERAREANLDAVLSSLGDGQLRDYTAGEAPPFLAPAADATGLRWFLASFYRNGVFNADRFEQVTDAFGRTLDAPPPLDPRWWSEGIAPLVTGAARMAATHPNVGGISIDTELYGTGRLMYDEGHGYEPSGWAVVVGALSAHDPDLGAKASAVPLQQRLAWLVARGLGPFAWRALEHAVAGHAATIREQAREIAPDLELAFYVPYFRATWFYRGLMRGWGTAQRPVMVLGYDAAPPAVRDALARDGVHVRTLGGVLAVRLTARDLETALHTAGDTSDGFWLFQYRDFGPEADPAERHDPVEAYWDAVRTAGERLEP